MRVEESIRIAAPREEVWDYISDPERYSEFMVNSTWEPCPGEPTTGPRARWTITLEVGSIDLSGLIEIVEWDPPHEIAWVNITGIDQRGRWILRDCGRDQTEVTLRASYQVPGGILALVASQLGKPLISRDIRRSLEALAESVRNGLIGETVAA